MMVSSPTQIALHPSYQEIIGMGEKALPFLFKKLDETPIFWFWALEAITGVHPILPSQQGKMGEMAKVWLSWAEENGYKW